jgi:hypothetical protein
VPTELSQGDKICAEDVVFTLLLASEVQTTFKYKLQCKLEFMRRDTKCHTVTRNLLL